MNLNVKGKQIDVGDALRGHVERNLDAIVAKYFERALEGTVTFSRDSRRFRADISVHARRGLLVQGGATSADAYAAFDGALERIAKQLRRYKRRLNSRRRAETFLPAQQYVLASGGEDEVPAAGQPAVIAEMPAEIATLTVGEAVMRLDLGDLAALMFRNRGHGRLNVVYRRRDGHVGWIDPAPEHRPEHRKG